MQVNIPYMDGMLCLKVFKPVQIEGQLVGVDGATFIKGYCTNVLYSL